MAPLIGILDACKVMFWKEYAKRGGNAADKELKPKGKFAYLGFLAVSGTHRRRQVGSVLVAASSEKARVPLPPPPPLAPLHSMCCGAPSLRKQ